MNDDRPPAISYHSLRVQRTVLAYVAPGLMMLVLALLGIVYNANENRAIAMQATMQTVLLRASAFSTAQANSKEVNARQDKSIDHLGTVQADHEHRITVQESGRK